MTAIEEANSAVTAWAQKPKPISSEMNRRFGDGHPLLNFLVVNDVGQCYPVTIAANGHAPGDTVAMGPGDRACSCQQAIPGQGMDIEPVVTFARRVCCFSGHLNRSHFSVVSGLHSKQGPSGSLIF
jgi:hypothetical protein